MAIDIPDFRAARVLVAGDVMLDRYWHGSTQRISPEAPVPVVRVETEEQRPGGSGNVALNIASLGARPILIGLVGADEAAHVLRQRLGELNVDCRLQTLEGSPTTTKLRILSRHQQLIRLDFEDLHGDVPDGRLLAEFRAALPEAEVVVFSDYAKGSLGRIETLIQLAREAGRLVLVDPKHGDFARYRGANVLTPNLAEFEAVVGRCADEEDLLRRGGALLQAQELDALLITRGEKGMSLLQRARDPRHLPTQAREVFDVTGAGDTVIAVLAAGLAAGLGMEAATQLANLAAGIVVGKLGTATASADELRQAMHEHQVVHRGIVEEDELLATLAAVRTQGERIVLTNGCFDILHAGHVAYLEQASRLGDRLVVAVNTDASVRRLKGEERPVNRLENRMAVLAALACVDWVVPFNEQTPERLICRLRPDFLVKGGDNDPEQIPGARCVRDAGGEVLVLDYVEGCSTSGLIRAIRGDPAK